MKSRVQLPFHTFQVLFCESESNYIGADFSAFLLTDKKKLHCDDYIVFYNSKYRLSSDSMHLLQVESPMQLDDTSPCDPEISIVEVEVLKDFWEYYCEGIKVNLDRVREEIQEIVFVASIYHQMMFFEEDIKVQIWHNGKLFYEEIYSEKYKKCNMLETIRIGRDKDEWFVESIGEESENGLESIVEKYF